MVVIERFVDSRELLPVLYLVLVAVQIIHDGIDERKMEIVNGITYYSIIFMKSFL